MLFRNAVALGVGGTFTQADIVGNLLTYTHNGSETVSDLFGCSVSDGIAPAITGQTFAITVTPQNDPLSITLQRRRARRPASTRTSNRDRGNDRHRYRSGRAVTRILDRGR